MKRAAHTIFYALAVPVGVATILWAASVGPKFFKSDFRRGQESVSTLDYLVRALDAYREQHGRYPEAKSMEELRKVLVPKYMADLRVRDGWGRPWQFAMSPNDYRIASFGADNAPGRGKRDPDYDIVVQNGTFVSFTPGAVVAFGR